jgi:hypothetical protein
MLRAVQPKLMTQQKTLLGIYLKYVKAVIKQVYKFFKNLTAVLLLLVNNQKQSKYPTSRADFTTCL